MGRLSLEDFMQEVKEKLQKRYKNLKVFTSENLKNNGTKVYAVTIVDRASSVSPCVNVEGYYKKFESGECDMEEIIKDMFEPGKKYVFDAELCRKDEYDVQDNGWINEIDGMEVMVITPILGRAKFYAISPTWCREVE